VQEGVSVPVTARQPELVARLQGLGTTIFSEMTELAIANDAVNLGQGFPDEDPPPDVVRAAVAAMEGGHNQYAPGPGVAALRVAVADHQRRFHGLDYDPDDEVTITFGATEAMAAAVQSLCEIGDEVVVLEPAYDAYRAVVALAGGVQRRVPVMSGDLRPDLDRLASSISARTRLVLVNTPHNPTGLVLTAEELDEIARVCVEHDLIAITDEVYEHLVYEGEHLPLAARPGMRERTVTISSAAKTFSCTGWKVGWACAPPTLTRALRIVKQYSTFSGATPFQHAVAIGLGQGDDDYERQLDLLRSRRDRLCDGLASLGLEVHRPQGTYFAVADVGPVGHADGEAFCRWAPEAIGVAAVPVAAFVDEPGPVRSLVRFAFCKPDAVIDAGLERLAALGPAGR
jgi:N-succinyldiaminopimelate aminotransferase